MEITKHTYQIGQDVSFGFNGDWYYAGKVTKITKKYLTTERGMKFYLVVRKVWTKINEFEYKDIPTEIFKSVGGGTWTLTHGIVEEQNPHF